jgi:hypothetical protein
MNKIIWLLLFSALTFPVPAQTKDTILFEITNSSHNGLKRSSTVFYFYQSGRVDCQAETKNITNRITKGKRSKCHQLSNAKITELTRLAGQTDFQAANERYFLFNGGIDWGRSLIITYFRKYGEKTISLKYSDGTLNKNSVPPSLKKFLSRIGRVDGRLETNDEFGT